jgi:hypothetical protein
VTAHALTIVTEKQRKHGYYLSYRCSTKGCNASGQITMPDRPEAMGLLAIITEGHEEMCRG